jgi:hypothetical protein
MPYDTTLKSTEGFSYPHPSSLAGTALADVRARFVEYRTHPSEEQWQAIASLLECLEAATDGFYALEPALYLSPIPCGVGKSQTIAAFARALAAAPDMDAVGMLILVNRINEARDTANALQECRAKLCVMTSDAKVNALGDHKDATGAQICVATQEALRIAMRSNLGIFDDCWQFNYRFGTRAVRVWDESFNFNRPVIVDSDTLLRPCKALQMLGKVAAKSALKLWSAELDRIPDGAGPTWETTAPDLRALGVDFEALAGKMNDDDDAHLCEALALVSGNKVGVTRGSFNAPTVITHYPEIPRSLMPLIVTDASALVNRAYAQMSKSGTPIIPLRDAGKTYANMTVRVVPHAASRSQYRKSETRTKLLDGVVRYIRESDRHVFVFGYKGLDFAPRTAAHRTLKAQLQHRLGKAQPVIDDEDLAKLMQKEGAVEALTAKGRVVFYLTHGRGTATNFYRCIDRVCLMGLDFPAVAVAHATSGSAQDLDLVNHHPTEEQIEEVYWGLLLDRTLQPGLRGSARVSKEGDCLPMELVVFQHPTTGLSRKQFSEVLFRGCRVVTDETIIPTPEAAKTHLRKLLEIAERRLKAGETVLSFGSLKATLGLLPGNFARLIGSDEWRAFLKDKKLVEVTLDHGKRGQKPKAYQLAT